MAWFYVSSSNRYYETERNGFASMLNEIRKNCPKVNSLKDLILQSCELHIDDNHVDYPRNAMHVYTTNKHCAIWNNKMLECIDSGVYTCLAYASKKDRPPNPFNVNFPDNPLKTCSLLKVLNVKVGAMVMLTTNIDVTDSLTNGGSGYCYKCCNNTQNSLNNVIDAILVQFDL